MADASNNLSVSLPTDFLTGSGSGLNLNFNFGGNADAIASSAYSFVNAGLANANGFLGNSITQTQGFINQQTAPGVQAVSKITDQMQGILPSLLSNLFKSANTAYQVQGAIATGAFQAQSQIAQASISASKSASSGGGFCFITTAVCETLGMEDDCDYLTVLRAFRDSYMSRTPERRALVRTYYALAPRYVEAIDRRKDAGAVYAQMLTLFIEPAIHAIARKDDDEAFALYCALVEYAKHKASEVTK